MAEKIIKTLRKTSVKSVAIVSIVLFAVINIGLLVKDDLTGSGAAHRRFVHELEAHEQPDVVILGSSLLMVFKPEEFSKELEKSWNKTVTTQSLAGPGQMISDDFVLTDKYLQGKTKPKLLVLGVAPRDFNDPSMPKAFRTPIFKSCCNINDVIAYGNLIFSKPEEQLECGLSNLSFLYNIRSALQERLQNKVVRGLDASKKTSVAEAKPEDIWTGEGWKKNRARLIASYQNNYQNYDQANVSNRMRLLEKIISTCKTREIKVLLINMPLAQSNTMYLPPLAYDRFQADLQQIANSYQIDYLNLANSPSFGEQDFKDTVHLTKDGAHKFLTTVVTSLQFSPNTYLSQKSRVGAY